MLEDIKSHARHYFILLIILLHGFGGLILFRYDQLVQLWFVFSTCSAYFLWGLIHHHLEKNATPKIIFEYLLISILAALLLTTLVIRA
jgi:surface polysaccharide O-acyltransferase-like enzyme